MKDIILDPGFGFGKDLQQNYAVLNGLEELRALELPLLIGVSRKRMIYQLVGGDASTALNGTTAIHAASLMKGANILRVHDVHQMMNGYKGVNMRQDEAAFRAERSSIGCSFPSKQHPVENGCMLK